jgi:ribonuclease P protein component
MLSKSQRLTRSEFSHHFKTGRRINSPYATLIVSPHTRFHGAVVVSKKVQRQAVQRNRLRRRAYSQLYNIAKHNQTGVYIFVLKPKLALLTKTQQHEALKALIAQV